MAVKTTETENTESLAIRSVKLAYIESIGTLLGIMIDEDIYPRKSIVKDFHVAYDTIRKFLDFDPNIKFETIAKFCYVIGHYLHVEHEAVDNYKSKKHIKDRDERLARIKQLQRQYEEIYGPGAEKVKDLIRKKVDLRQYCESGPVK